MKKISLLAASVLAALGLSACAVTPTPYQPAGYSAATGGFSELQLEQNRFRVNFSGNSYTRRDVVENYLLLRAAELTLSQGADWFATVNRDTERRTRYRDYGFGRSSFGYGYGFHPSWRYYGRFGGGYGWSPFYDPFGWDRDVDVREINRYEATAEIITGRGPKPVNDPNAFDARDIVSRLGPTVVRPV